MLKNDFLHRSLGIIAVMFILQACQNSPQAVVSTPVSQVVVTPTIELASAPTIQPDATPTVQLAATVTPETPLTLPSDLSPTGKLILSDYNTGISEFDFTTMKLVPRFHPPNNGFVGPSVLSPDGKTFVMIYSIPRDIGDPQYGAADLYTLAADGSAEPKLLLNTTESGDYYFSPWWAPDGQSIYYGRLYTPISGTPTKPTGYFLTRYAYPKGPAQELHDNVLSVRISADGTKLFYVSVNPQTTLSNIYVTDLDGKNGKAVLPDGETWIIDSIAISPDGQSVTFNKGVQETSQSGMSLLDLLLGTRIASAHNLPSDIWIIKLGGTPQKLTDLEGYGFVADFSPDGQYIAFSCDSGVYIMKSDGTRQTKVSNVANFSMLQWVP